MKTSELLKDALYNHGYLNVYCKECFCYVIADIGRYYEIDTSWLYDIINWSMVQINGKHEAFLRLALSTRDNVGYLYTDKAYKVEAFKHWEGLISFFEELEKEQ